MYYELGASDRYGAHSQQTARVAATRLHAVFSVCHWILSESHMSATPDMENKNILKPN